MAVLPMFLAINLLCFVKKEIFIFLRRSMTHVWSLDVEFTPKKILGFSVIVFGVDLESVNKFAIRRFAGWLCLFPCLLSRGFSTDSKL